MYEYMCQYLFDTVLNTHLFPFLLSHLSWHHIPVVLVWLPAQKFFLLPHPNYQPEDISMNLEWPSVSYHTGFYQNLCGDSEVENLDQLKQRWPSSQMDRQTDLTVSVCLVYWHIVLYTHNNSKCSHFALHSAFIFVCFYLMFQGMLTN
jgi:hypothetical protein